MHSKIYDAKVNIHSKKTSVSIARTKNAKKILIFLHFLLDN